MAGQRRVTDSQAQRWARNARLNASEILDLRDARARALHEARPELPDYKVRALLAAWYRGKPGTGPVGKILQAAGLLANPGKPDRA